MNVINSYLKKHPNYTQKKTMTVKGLMLHSVGVAQPSAAVFFKKWNNASMSKGVHAMIDANTGDIYQFLPWSYKAWHCGSGKNGSGNNSYIGVEMCESNAIKYAYGDKFTIKDKAKASAQAIATYQSAVELFAMLCRSYKLDPMTDIISHSEGHSKGIASGHSDPEHYWKGLSLPFTMDGFRKDVYKAMNPTSTGTPSAEKSYKVKITADSLNVRKGAGTLYGKVTSLKKNGVYTIISEKNGWGLLKSKAGWISLKYTKKI